MKRTNSITVFGNPSARSGNRFDNNRVAKKVDYLRIRCGGDDSTAPARIAEIDFRRCRELLPPVVFRVGVHILVSCPIYVCKSYVRER